MMANIDVKAAVKPELDLDFIPAVLWNREYRRIVRECGRGVKLAIALERSNGAVSRFDTEILPHEGDGAALNMKYVERLVKFLLWMKGGYRVTIGGCPEVAAALGEIYSSSGRRSFDHAIMGMKIYGRPFEVRASAYADAPAEREVQVKMGGHLDGCRVGFDLGGSDRKCAAVINGETVFTEEIGWDPYFQKEPQYHIDGIRDSIRRAASKMPRLDAIGGSAAGVYVDNEPRIASLFRGISDEDFRKHIVGMFHELQQEFGNVPMIVANDGDVTALAGAMSMQAEGVLGLSMGTSQAVGYVNLEGNITDWLNELAFAPVDYREDAPVDEWSGDIGCGVQYFSQQAVARLAPAAGIEFAATVPFPERLVEVQRLMAAGDERATGIYRSIGVYFGYAIAHYAEFYDIRNLLILGRVTSGAGGNLVLDVAEQVLRREFPELAGMIKFRTPDEKFKRHGQAVIAASLPELKR